MQPPKTRSGHQQHQPYPLNEFPYDVLAAIAKRLFHHVAVGNSDLAGDEWERIFADSIGGDPFSTTSKIADVQWNGMAWSVKTYKKRSPHTCKELRVISGRNSPIHSFHIDDWLDDIQATGASVLSIYNSRLAEARGDHDEVRWCVLIRNMSSLEFTMYERPIVEFVPNNYEWHIRETPKSRTLWGFDDEGNHCFTWQPSGGQFSIVERVPRAAAKFRLRRRPSIITLDQALKFAGWRDNLLETIPVEIK